MVGRIHPDSSPSRRWDVLEGRTGRAGDPLVLSATTLLVATGLVPPEGSENVSEMIERVAAILGDALDRHIQSGDLVLTPIGKISVKDWAEEVVAAMREPTGDMCQAALLTAVRENKGIEYSPAQGWKAMIDEALKEP